MPYEVDVNRAGSTRIRQEVSLETKGRVQGRDSAAPHYKFYELEPAIVIEVDLTNKDATKIGYAKVRPLYSYATVPEDNLPIAVPLDTNIKSYPLKDEVVIVVEYNGRMYYSQRLNYFNLINNNITKNPYSYLLGDEQTKDNISQTALGNPNSAQTSEESYHYYFTPDNSVQSLLPMEGDIIFEGRFGNSIRFGGTVDKTVTKIDQRFRGTWAIGEKKGSPIIIIRSGQKKTSGTFLYKNSIVEDINKDPSSIYITTDQIIPFQPSSKKTMSYRGTYPNLWDGAQILISSDRLVFNAKKEGIYLISPKTVGISTDGTFNVDASNLVIFNTQRINLGLNAAEPAVKGYAWLKMMIKLLTALSTEQHPTPAGISGFPSNASVYNDILNELQTALSNVTFTE